MENLNFTKKKLVLKIQKIFITSQKVTDCKSTKQTYNTEKVVIRRS